MGGEMRVMMVGDLHANTSAAMVVIDHAASLNTDLILQVGDFGFWPRTKSGRKFLHKVETRLALHGLDLWWLDGNHEDFDRLDARPVGEDGRRRISAHVWHLPRGYRWTWGETRWVAAGGAVSVDAYYRQPGDSWFIEEALTDAQAHQIITDGPADVVVAHDAPWGVPRLGYRLSQDLPVEERINEWPEELIVASDQHQKRVRWVVDGVQAQRLFHGHHHLRYSDILSTEHGPVQVEGLGRDSNPLAALCLLVDGDGWPILEVAA